MCGPAPSRQLMSLSCPVNYAGVGQPPKAGLQERVHLQEIDAIDEGRTRMGACVAAI
jgi:hypothetical protein